MQQYSTRHFNVEIEPSSKGKNVADFLAGVGYIMQERNRYH